MQRLQLDNVVKIYADKTAVNRISLQVEEGEIYGLLGANGAGKTTTMRMVLGLIYPDDGTILYNGKPYNKELRHIMGTCRKNAGYTRK